MLFLSSWLHCTLRPVQCCHPTFVDRRAAFVSFAPVFYSRCCFYRGDIKRDARTLAHAFFPFSFRLFGSTFIQMYRYHRHKIVPHFTIPSCSIHICICVCIKYENIHSSLILMYKQCQMNRSHRRNNNICNLSNICVYFCRRQTSQHDAEYFERAHDSLLPFLKEHHISDESNDVWLGSF